MMKILVVLAFVGLACAAVTNEPGKDPVKPLGDSKSPASASSIWSYNGLLGYFESLLDSSSSQGGSDSASKAASGTRSNDVGPASSITSVCNIDNCSKCKNTSTCRECANGFGLTDDEKSCLTDECDQIAGGVKEVCQDYRLTVNNLINKQINEELIASYIYMDMGQFFDRADVAYRGFSKFFKKASEEERDHAQKLMDYMNKRGGNIKLSFIQAPSWEREKIKMSDSDTGLFTITQSPIHAVEKALETERYVNDKLLKLHELARTHKDDPHLQDFLEGEYLTEQVDAIKQLADWKVILRRMESEPVGIMMFDLELHEGKR